MTQQPRPRTCKRLRTQLYTEPGYTPSIGLLSGVCMFVCRCRCMFICMVRNVHVSFGFSGPQAMNELQRQGALLQSECA